MKIGRNCNTAAHDLARIAQRNRDSVVWLPPFSDAISSLCNSDKLDSVEKYCEHESLAYGADWQTNEVSEHTTDSSVIATCSFYDSQPLKL